MNGLTDYITKANWVDIFTIWYVLIDDAYQQLVASLGHRLRQRGPEPLFGDSEVITVALLIETFFHGHEALGLAFVDQYHRDLFPRLLEQSQFNRRRRALTGVMELIRRQLTNVLIDPLDRTRLLDSAPVPACTYTRQNECETAMGMDYRGVVVSKRAKLFGHRFYATTTTSQVVDRWMIAPAGLKEGKAMPEFFTNQADLFVLADNGFHAPSEIHWLHAQRQIAVVPAKRKDARVPHPAWFRRLHRRMRRLIETAFSVLTVVFNLETPGSRSLGGLLSRITTTVLAYNLSFLTNVELLALE
jgi:hypothetical protein